MLIQHLQYDPCAQSVSEGTSLDFSGSCPRGLGLIFLVVTGQGKFSFQHQGQSYKASLGVTGLKGSKSFFLSKFIRSFIYLFYRHAAVSPSSSPSSSPLPPLSVPAPHPLLLCFRLGKGSSLS